MGCDIHFFTERKTSSNNYQGPKDLSEDRNNKIEQIIDNKPVEERWVSADYWEIEDESWGVPYSRSYYKGRNYYLFSILAGVRGDTEPIDYPRGIPEDSSSGYSYITNQWEGDGHSHSYFTLKELLEVDWDYYQKEHLSEFMETIEKMKLVNNDPEKVRCVFFFDN